MNIYICYCILSLLGINWHCLGSTIQQTASQSNKTFAEEVFLSSDIIEDDGKIVGGQPTQKNEFPWLVTIESAGGLFEGGYFCGGSIIDSEWVLTAAHCCVSSAESYTVTGGVYDRNNFNGDEIEMRVTKVIQHPDYDSGTAQNDIGLLKLGGQFPLKTNKGIVSAIHLPPRDFKTDGVQFTVAGWGVTSEHGNQPNKPLKVFITGKPNSKCDLRDLPTLNSTSSSSQDDQVQGQQEVGTVIRDVLPPNQVCAGGSGKSSCYGDSGSALIGRSQKNNDALCVGVVSAGKQCGRAGIYSRVSFYIDWIEQCTGLKF